MVSQLFSIFEYSSNIYKTSVSVTVPKLCINNQEWFGLVLGRIKYGELSQVLSEVSVNKL